MKRENSMNHFKQRPYLPIALLIIILFVLFAPAFSYQNEPDNFRG
jgi:hypothetical protein